MHAAATRLTWFRKAMLKMPSLRLLAIGVLVQCSTSATVQDLRRAQTKKPRDAFRGPSQSEMSKTLNKHLRRLGAKKFKFNEWCVLPGAEACTFENKGL